MSEQAKQTLNGETVYRWYVYTSEGRKVTWAPSKKAVQDKASRWGLKVVKIVPALSLLDEVNTGV